MATLVPFDINAYVAKTKTTVASGTNNSAIGLKQGTVVNVPETIGDKFSGIANFLKENWKLAAIGAVAILVLIKD